jgi:hypothetical protein
MFPESRSERMSSLAKNEPLVSFLAAEQGGEKLLVLAFRERFQGERGKAGISAKAVDHPGQGRAFDHLGRSVGGEDEGRGRTQASDDVLQGLDRHLGSMEIFQGKNDGSTRGETGDCAGQEFEDLISVLQGPRLTRDRNALGAGRADLLDFAEHGEERDQVVGDIG